MVLERSLKGSRFWQPTLSEDGIAKTYCKAAFGPTILNDYVLDFIDKYHNQPFFIHYNPVLAHDPWTTTPDSLDAKTPKEKFSGMMSYLDKMVGRVIRKARRTQLVREHAHLVHWRQWHSPANHFRSSRNSHCRRKMAFERRGDPCAFHSPMEKEASGRGRPRRPGRGFGCIPYPCFGDWREIASTA